MLGTLIGRLGGAGDLTAARALERALRELLGDGGEVGADGEVIDLSTWRKR